jgi:hypothetical protein
VFATTADGASSPTERLRITSDGTLQLRNSPGIDFSQIQTNASGMTSETLDSYEEGTWTVGTNNTSTGTLGTCSGKYVKIGRIVFCTLNFSGTNFGGTGTVYITGLPFSHGGSSNDPAFSFNDCGHTVGIGNTANNPRLRVSGTQLQGVESLGGTTYLNWTELGGGSGTLEFRAVFTYMAGA